MPAAPVSSTSLSAPLPPPPLNVSGAASSPLALLAGAVPVGPALAPAAASVAGVAPALPERKGVWVVKPGAPVWDNANDWLERAFVRLFPFACGGPSDKRRQVSVSRAECITHYLRTGLRGFAQPEFALHNYDIRARAEMASNAFVRARCPASTHFSRSASSNSSQSSPVHAHTFILCSDSLCASVILC
jgi:hypothetical protein